MRVQEKAAVSAGRIIASSTKVVETIGPGHGFLYMVYLALAFDLGRRAQWPLSRMILVMLADVCGILANPRLRHQ